MRFAESWNSGYHVASGWTVFELEGRDVSDWLQRQGTQDIRKLDNVGVLWNAFLNRRGEIECLFMMARAGDALLILTPPGFRDAFLDRVEQYVILDDTAARVLFDQAPVVALAGNDAAAALAAVFSLTPEAVPLLTDRAAGVVPVSLAGEEVLLWRFTWGGLPVLFLFPPEPDAHHAERLAGRLNEAGVVSLSPEGWEVLTTLAGYPLPDEPGILLPETPWDLSALGENKGCYPGQEVVARLRAYGAVRRRLMALKWLPGALPRGDLLVPGARLRQPDGSAVGRVYRHVPVPAALERLAGRQPAAVTLCWMDKSCREPGVRLCLEDGSSGTPLGEAELLDLPVWSLPDARGDARLLVDQARRWFEEDPADTDARPLEAMIQALLMDPGCSEYYETLTVMLIRRKRYADALPVARAWVSRFPDEIMAHGNLSLILANLGHIREAEAEKDIARRLETARDLEHRKQDPVSEEERRRQARAEAEERIALFREALAYDPDDPVALMGLGVALQALDCVEEAVGCFRRAVEVDPGYSVAWLRLGECLEAAGDRNGALEAWREGARVARQRGDMMPARAMESRARELSAAAGNAN
ncbi:MAG TPA: tetratricopeptide repeat protein [Candidatus Hydrogenedentes bacterium]|nr:tetratricopeptide repeat protein [Candidatus Hydrogenedentota bacterium]